MSSHEVGGIHTCVFALEMRKREVEIDLAKKNVLVHARVGKTAVLCSYANRFLDCVSVGFKRLVAWLFICRT
jgi:hypothetical protein